MTIFVGSGVAAVTPFTSEGKVDFKAYEQLIDFLVTNGSDAIVACGTTGEAATLSKEEHVNTVRCAVSAVAGRVPVIAGAGSNDTAFGVSLTEEAEKAGADACLLVTPYYNKTSQKGLIQHFTAQAESVSIPMILYNVPGRTGLNIEAKTAFALSKVPNIVAIKEASGNISQIAEIAHLCGPDFTIYSGNDDQIVPVLSLGGKGVISVLGNVAPRQTHEIVMKYLEGDIEGSLKMQLDALPLIQSLFCEVNPIPVKTALRLMGMAVGGFRLPLTEMDETQRDRLKQAMADYGLLPH